MSNPSRCPTILVFLFGFICGAIALRIGALSLVPLGRNCGSSGLLGRWRGLGGRPAFTIHGLVAGKVDQLHDCIFAESNYHASYEPMRCIRTERYKYIR